MRGFFETYKLDFWSLAEILLRFGWDAEISLRFCLSIAGSAASASQLKGDPWGNHVFKRSKVSLVKRSFEVFFGLKQLILGHFWPIS